LLKLSFLYQVWSFYSSVCEFGSGNISPDQSNFFKLFELLTEALSSI
jgi:hypothetical protein